MRVTIVGSGIVGSATGIGLAKMGNDVTFYDKNAETLARLEHGGKSIARSLREGVERSHVLVLCLPTPISREGFDLSCVYEVANGISNLLKDQTVVLRSTVLPGTTKKLSCILPADRLIYNPEFLREAFAPDDFLNPHRIVIGAQSDTAFHVGEALYTGFDVPIVKTDWETAEVSKLVSNAFLASKISFFNEAWLMCRKLGLEPNKVENIVALDERIGLYGTKGGSPFGGACLPKDTEALAWFAKANGHDPTMLDCTLRVNEAMKFHINQPKVRVENQADIRRVIERA